MNQKETDFLKNEIVKMKGRVKKGERRILAGKNPEEERKRCDRLLLLISEKEALLSQEEKPAE